jgi:hypothetical protein
MSLGTITKEFLYDTNVIVQHIKKWLNPSLRLFWLSSNNLGKDKIPREEKYYYSTLRHINKVIFSVVVL